MNREILFLISVVLAGCQSVMPVARGINTAHLPLGSSTSESLGKVTKSSSATGGGIQALEESNSRVSTALEISQSPATVSQLENAVYLANTAAEQSAQSLAAVAKAAQDVQAAQALALDSSNKANDSLAKANQLVADTQAKLDAALVKLDASNSAGDLASAAAASAAAAQAKADAAAARAAQAEAQAQAAIAAANLTDARAAAAAAAATVAAANAADAQTKAGQAVDATNALASKVQFSVKDFGAKGDGVTDDTNAFRSAISKAEAAASTTNEFAVSNLRGNVSIYVPPGEYLITQGEALMQGTYTKRTVGLSIFGAGRGISRIMFKPSTAGVSLMKNNDAWLQIKVSDLEFNSSVAQSNFMDSVSTGGAQNYVFEDVNWNGYWNNLFNLSGTNCNSEMTWRHCGFNGQIGRAVYNSQAVGSDQFLNFNFYDCQFEVDKGDFLDFQKGGNINIWGGSLIHGPGGGTFFRLQGGPHAYGTQRLLCIGARIEHRTANSLLIDNQWDNGIISFINVDCSSSTSIVAPGAITAKFNSGNASMPNVQFDNCSLMGVHQYSDGVGAWAKAHNVTYSNCEFTQAKSPQEFIVSSEVGGHPNVGGRPTIDFVNCRSISGDQTQIWDTTLNLNVAAVGTSTKKVLSLKGPSGRFPTLGQSVGAVLPLNSIITRIDVFSPAGAVTSQGPALFTVQTGEAVPTVLTQVNQTPHSAGFDSQKQLHFVCDSDLKCRLSLVAGPTVDQPNPSAYCLIEYI